jgi:hypothetical protein
MLNFECKVAENASWDLANKDKIFPTLLVENNFMICRKLTKTSRFCSRKLLFLTFIKIKCKLLT